jgi:hypothetical protein
MRHKLTVIILALGVPHALTPSFAAAGEMQPAQVTNTTRVSFQGGGLIRVDASYGNLNIDGWDRPEVEVTVTKSMPYDFAPGHPEQARKHLEAVRVITERRSDSELLISTIHPHNAGRFPLRFPGANTGGVRLDYEVHVPRTSRLDVQHGDGYVSVSNVIGGIDASSSRGDIMLLLPDAGPWSIDAKCRIGPVTSDLAGNAHLAHLVGERFATTNSSPARRIRLRMGIGGITIKQDLPG